MCRSGVAATKTSKTGDSAPVIADNGLTYQGRASDDKHAERVAKHAEEQRDNMLNSKKYIQSLTLSPIELSDPTVPILYRLRLQITSRRSSTKKISHNSKMFDFQFFSLFYDSLSVRQELRKSAWTIDLLLTAIIHNQNDYSVIWSNVSSKCCSTLSN